MEKKRTFTEVALMWFKYFSEMQPGDQIEIAVKGKRDPALFIDVCKEFIDQGNPSFEFSNDYKFFRRINSF